MDSKRSSSKRESSSAFFQEPKNPMSRMKATITKLLKNYLAEKDREFWWNALDKLKIADANNFLEKLPNIKTEAELSVALEASFRANEDAIDKKGHCWQNSCSDIGSYGSVLIKIYMKSMELNLRLVGTISEDGKEFFRRKKNIFDLLHSTEFASYRR
jgi:hypothetical protein